MEAKTRSLTTGCYWVPYLGHSFFLRIQEYFKPCQRVVKMSCNLYKSSSYLPTPPIGQDMTQGQFLSGV